MTASINAIERAYLGKNLSEANRRIHVAKRLVLIMRRKLDADADPVIASAELNQWLEQIESALDG